MPSSQSTPSFHDRFGRRIWGTVVLLLGVVLVASLPMSASGVAEAEARAEQRAEEISGSVIEPELTLDLLSRDISGTAYRDLTVRVQGGILSDDRIDVVRIWRLDGALIYSSAQRDDVAGAAARRDRAIERAFLGQTTSVRSSEGARHEGLRRETEELFRTYVPVRLSDADRVDGVVEIDQRHTAIRAEALGIWRPVQVAGGAAFLVSIVLFVRAVRHAPPRPKPWQPEQEDKKDERRRAPWRRGGPSDQASQQALGVASPTGVALPTGIAPPTGAAGHGGVHAAGIQAPAVPAVPSAELEALELKLRASEAELEQQATELQRVKAVLAARDTELAEARSGATGTRAEAKRVKRLVTDAEQRATEAERRAADAERKFEEASKRATSAAGRALEAEARVGELERDQEVSERTRRKDPGDRKLTAELKRVHTERERLARMLAEREEELARVKDELDLEVDRLRSELEAHGRAAEMTGAELTRRVDELERANAELEAHNGELGSRNRELESRHRQLTEELEARAREVAAANGDGSGSQTEERLAEALAKLDELERTRRSVDGDGEASDVASLRDRVAELERARRDDIAELQRAQQSFANAQVELVNTNRELKEAEALIHELEQARRAGGWPAPEALPDGWDAERPMVAGADEQGSPEHAEGSVPEHALAGVPLERSVADDAVEPAPFDDAGSDVPMPSWSSPATPPEPEADEPPAGGLSLRERLARAAAGRRRGPLS